MHFLEEGGRRELWLEGCMVAGAGVGAGAGLCSQPPDHVLAGHPKLSYLGLNVAHFQMMVQLSGLV